MGRRTKLPQKLKNIAHIHTAYVALDPNSVKYRVEKRRVIMLVTIIMHILYPNTSHRCPHMTLPPKILIVKKTL